MPISNRSHSTRRAVGFSAMGLVLLATSACFGSAGRPSVDENRAVFALLQEPDLMNPLFSIEGAADLSLGMVQEPLLEARDDSSYAPILAEEEPTVENGGVSADGLTVTFRLREGITWSDGEAMDTEDLVFTYDVIRDQSAAVVAQPAYDAVESVTAVDARTLRVRMSAINPQYRDLFSAILPEHRFEDTAIESGDPLARLPLGTGPFVFDEWRSGDRMTLDANDDYWRDPDLPRLDGITWQVVPDRNTAVTAIARGEYDSLWFPLSSDAAAFESGEDAGDLTVESVERPGLIEWIWFNHGDPADMSRPHPVLGDVAVRRAIDLSIDRESIIETALDGYGSTETAPINSGALACQTDPPTFDQDESARLLDEAGWVPGSDGVRAKDGQRAELRFTTVSGSPSRELYQQTIQEDLGEIGIEVTIENVDSNVLFAGFGEDGKLARGDYDMVMTLDGLRVPDPSEFMRVFTSGVIPSAQNPAGFTYTHWSDSDYDRTISQAAQTVEEGERKQAYQRACDIFEDQKVASPIFASEDINVWNSRLADVDDSGFTGMWGNSSIATWDLS